MKNQITFTILILLLFGNQISATNYYLSASGNDANPGTSSALAWKTITQLNTKLADNTIQPGDSIFFKRAGTFEGQINVNTNNLYFGVWGTGNKKAIIKGSKKITGWTLVSGNTWRATLTTAPSSLFSKGIYQTPARYPNKDWLFLDNSGTTTAVNDPDIGASGINWTGGAIVLRTVDWLYETRNVTAQSGNQINYPAMSYTPGAGRNFYLTGVQAALDTLGEWFYNATEQKIYYVAPAGINPKKLTMEAGIYENGIKTNWNPTQIRIENLEFRYQSAEGVWLAGAGAADNTIKNCIFRSCKTGTWVMGTNIVVQGNKFEDVLYRGMTAELSGTSAVSTNTFKRIGLYPLFQDYSAGIFIFQSAAIYNNNTLDSCGGDGIRINVSSNFTLEKNIVTNALLTISDGGGIYSYDSNNGTIRQNFVSLIKGDINGTPGGIANGIYIDNYCHNINVENNTVYDVSGDGLVSNAGTNHLTFRANTVYNCLSGLGFYDWIQNNSIYGCRTAKNILYSLEPELFPMRLYSGFNLYNVSTFDSNYYFNPYSFFSINRSAFSSAPVYNLASWTPLYPEDTHSKEAWFNQVRYPVSGAPGAELITNGSLTTNANGWSCWSDNGGSCSDTWDNTAGMTGGALRFEFGGSASYGIAISPEFAVVAGQWYNLKVQLKSDLTQDIDLQLQQNYGNYQVLQSFALLPARSDTARSFNITFQCSNTDNPVRINFRSSKPGQKIWIDEVSLRPVTVSNPDPKLDHRLFVNPTGNNKSFSLSGVAYKNLDNQTVTGSIVVAPWSSRILIRSGAITMAAPTAEVRETVFEEEKSISSPTDLKLYPNPVSERLFLEIAATAVSQVIVYDATGKLVLQTDYSNQTGISVANLAQGFYLVEVKLNNGEKRSASFVKL